MTIACRLRCNWCKHAEITNLKVNQVIYYMKTMMAWIVFGLNATMPLLLSYRYGNWQPYSLPRCDYIFSFKRSSATYWPLNPSRNPCRNPSRSLQSKVNLDKILVMILRSEYILLWFLSITGNLIIIYFWKSWR